MSDDPRAPLLAAGLPSAAVVAEWAPPAASGAYEADAARYGTFWKLSRRLVGTLPAKPKRSPVESAAAVAMLSAARASRERFLSAHADRVHDAATTGRSRFLRVDELAWRAAALVPGLVPTEQEVAAEARLDQGDKDGVEIDQGIFLAHVLGNPRAGLHLCHASLLPRPESAELAARFARDGTLDLGAARLTRLGDSPAVLLTTTNPRFLNAEDDTTLDQMETAVDVAILDGASTIAVMRGGAVDHPRYAGRPVFGAGINLTHLYRGRIPFLWYLRRDLGWVLKVLRGVATPEALPDDVRGAGIEKPWVAAVDAFAIGGHCQALLCMDYTIAAADAFMTLPARKEGIIPGLANMRMPRFTGDRIARQAIQYGRQLPCDSPEGRLICDEIVPATEMDQAILRVATGLASAGAVGAVGNRRAFRVAQEPLDLFRRYCAVYAREQAYCHFSPALIANLERNWNAASRRP
jgi:(3,5-dihydroxyphenyl)acetyl-CoA 1,2-dioxygenase